MKLAVKVLFTLVSLCISMQIYAGLRTIINTSDVAQPFYALDSHGQLAGSVTTIQPHKWGLIDLGDNNGCVSIFAGDTNGFKEMSRNKLCDGGQLCWDGKSFGWQAWGLPCNKVDTRNPNHKSQ